MEITKTLLADDHALIRAGLRDALNGIPGVEIIGEAGNGPDMLTALNALRPDLLVMDVNMPDFDPVAAVIHIRKENPALKILVVSAYDDRTYVVGLLSAGVNGYHLKDQPLSDLQLAIRRILDGGRWISDPLVNRLVDQDPIAPTPHSPLTRRQRELLYLLTQGYNNQKIAQSMDLSVKTVENHLTALYRALGVESRLEANSYALRHPELLSVPGQEKPHHKPENPIAEKVNILIVDDNPRYRAQLGKLVGRMYPSSTVYEAEDSAEALRLAAQIRPRLAFIDVVLRDEDGIQCARSLRGISPATRMILISAYPDREFRRMALHAGALAFLDKKDIDAAALKQVLEDALNSSVS
jgi:DNA-binding NarL/FixJ family response regulator